MHARNVTSFLPQPLYLAALFVITGVFLFLPSVSHAATKYWIGTAGGNFSTATNWSTTAASACGANANTTAPTSADVAHFTSTCTNNATLDTTVDVGGININSGYTGTISPSSAISITIGSTGFIQADGTFTATSGTTSIESIFTRTGGTFVHNSGTVRILVHASATFTPGTSLTLHNLSFARTSTAAITPATTLAAGFTVANDLTMSNSSSFGITIQGASSVNPIVSVAGTISIPSTAQSGSLTVGSSTAASNFTITSTGNYSMADSSTSMLAHLTFNGTGDQTITHSAGTISTGTWTVNKASGTLGTASTFTSTSPLTLTAGTFAPTHDITFDDLTLNGGTFTGSSANATFDAFTSSSGTMTAPSGTMIFANTFNRTGGTFTHNNGTVEILVHVSHTITPGTNLTFYNFSFRRTSTSISTFIATINAGFTVANNFSVSNANSGNIASSIVGATSANPTITVLGNFVMPSTAQSGTMTIGSTTASANFTIALGGDFTLSDSSIVLRTDVTINGTGTQNLTYTAGGTIGTGIWTVNKASGTLGTSSTFTSTSPLTLTSGTFAPTHDITFDDLTLNGGTFTGSSANATFDAFTSSSGTMTAPSGTMIFANTFNRTGGTFTHNNGTVEILIHVSLTITPGTDLTFYNFSFRRTSTSVSTFIATINAGFTVANNFAVSNANSSNIASSIVGATSANPTITVLGSFLMPSTAQSGGMTIGSTTATANFTVNVGGDFTLSDTSITLRTNVTFNGTGTQTLTYTAGNTIGTGTWTVNKASGTLGTASTFTSTSPLTLTAGTFAPTHDITFDDLTLNGGTFTGSSANATFDAFTSSSGIMTAPSGTLTFANTFNRTGGTFTHNNGTVRILGNASFTITPGTSLTFYNLTFDRTATAAGTFTMTLAASFAVANDLVVSNASSTGNVVLVGTSGVIPTITVGGNMSLPAAIVSALTIGSSSPSTNFAINLAGNFTMSDSNVTQHAHLTLNGTGTQIWTRSVGSFQADLTINKASGEAQLGSAFASAATGQDVIIEEGTFDISGFALTVNNTSSTLVVQDGGNLQLQGGETITALTGNPSLASGSTVTYDGTAGPYTVKNYSYHHLRFNGSGAVFNLAATESLAGNLIVSAGTFDTEGFSLTVTGTVSNDGTIRLLGNETTFSATMDTDSGTVVYDGTGSYTGLKAGNSYYNLTFNGTGGTWTQNAAVDVNGTLTLTAGTLSTGGNSITLAGDWSNSATFTHGNGTVTLDGTNQTITGSANTTFYNLIKSVSSAATLTFNNARTTTIANNTTLQGASSNLLSLRSDSDGTQWEIDPSSSGTRTFQYLDVKDSNNTNATAISCTNCTNSGNNTNWTIATPVSFAGVVYSDEGTTPLTSKTVALSINGATATTTTSDASTGAYTFASVVISSGDVLTVYLDNHTEDAVTVTKGTGSDMTSVDVYQNRLITRSDSGVALTNANLDTANNNGDADISAIYTTSGSTVTVVAGKELFIAASQTYAPGATTAVGTGGMDVRGTFTHGSETLTVSGDFNQSSGTFSGGSGPITFSAFYTLSGGTFTATSGTTTTRQTVTISGGTFNHNSGTWLHAPSANYGFSLSANQTFYNLTLNATTGSSGMSVTGAGMIIVNGTLTLTEGSWTAGTINAKGPVAIDATFNGGSPTGGVVLIDGSGNQSFTVGSGAELPGITLNNSSTTISFAGDASFDGTFTLQSGTFTAPSGTMTSRGTVTITGGTFNHNSGSWIHAPGANYAITNAGGAVFNNLAYSPTGNNTMGCSSTTITTEGTLALNTGVTSGCAFVAKGNVTIGTGVGTSTATIEFSGTANQIYTDEGGNEPDGTYTINKASGTVTLASVMEASATGQDLTITSGTLDLAGFNLTVTDVFTLGASGRLKLHGSETVSTIDTVTAGSTVEYYGTSSYTTSLAAGNSYSNLTFSGSGGVWEPNGAVTVGQGLTITNGTFDIDGQNLTVTGTFSNSGTLRLTGGETTVSLTNDTDSGTVEYDGTGTYASLKAGNSYYHVIFNGAAGSWTQNATLDVNGNLAITQGTLASSGNAITLAGNFTNAGTYTPGSNTVTFDGTSGTKTLTSGGASFNNLTVNDGGGSLTLELQDALDVNGNLTITGGTLDTKASSNFAITLAGNWSNADTFLARSGTVTLDGTVSGKTITSGGNAFNNLTVNGSGGVWTLADALDINGNATFTAGTLDASGSNYAITVGGSWSDASNLFAEQAGTVTFDGSGSSNTINEGGNFYNVAWSGTGTWDAASALTATNNCTLNSGSTLDLSGHNLTCGGTFTTGGTLRLRGTETSVTSPTNLTAAGTVAYDNTATVNSFLLGNTYNNLTLQGSGTIALAANLDTNGNLTVSSGTLDANGFDLTIGGNVLSTGSIANTSGRTILLDGGTQSFNPGNITIGTLNLSGSSGTVTSGSNFSISNLLSIATSKVINLVSFTLTSTGNITNAGTITQGSGKVVDPSSSFYIADSSYDADDAVSLGVDSVYLTLIDEDGNVDGQSPDTLAVTVTCPTDSEAITLTETGNATELFRFAAGLPTSLYGGSASNNDGTLTCADGATITATYLDAQDNTDTQSDTSTATSDTIPTAPSSFAGTADSATAITWTWTDNANNEAGFKLYDASNTLIATISSANTTSYTENALSPATSYTRKIVAYNNAGNSSFSNSASATTDGLISTPDAPSSFAGTASSSTSITWTWTDNADDEDGFRLLDSDNNVKASIAANATSYTETGLAADSSHTRKVVAYNTVGTSAASNTATVATSSTGPSAPELVSPVNEARLSTDLPSFSFNRSTDSDDGIASYTLILNAGTGSQKTITFSNPASDSSTTTDAAVISATDTRITVALRDRELLGEGAHTWKVRATDASGQSTDSNTREFTITFATEESSPDPTNPVSITPTSQTKITTTTIPIIPPAAPRQTIAQVIEQIAQGTLPSRIPAALQLPELAKQVELQQEQKAFNLQQFLMAFFPLERLQAFDNILAFYINHFTQQVLAFGEAGQTYVAALTNQLWSTTLAWLDQQQALLASWGSAIANTLAQIQIDRPRLATFTNPFLPFWQQFETQQTLLSTRITAINPLTWFERFMIRANDVMVAARSQRLNLALRNEQRLDDALAPGIAMARRIRVGGELALESVRGRYDEPLAITNVTIAELSPNRAVISWETSRLTTGKINWGPTVSYGADGQGGEALSLDLKNKHAVELSPLSPDQKLYFEVVVTDVTSTSTADAYYTFTTPAK